MFIFLTEIRPRPGYIACRAPEWKIFITSREKSNTSKRAVSFHAWGSNATEHVTCLCRQLRLWLVLPSPFPLRNVIITYFRYGGAVIIFFILLAFPLQFCWLWESPPAAGQSLYTGHSGIAFLSLRCLHDAVKPLLAINLPISVDLPLRDKCLRMELLEQRPKHLYGPPDLLTY